MLKRLLLNAFLPDLAFASWQLHLLLVRSYRFRIKTPNASAPKPASASKGSGEAVCGNPFSPFSPAAALSLAAVWSELGVVPWSDICFGCFSVWPAEAD
jgi:hypothetical protein